MNQFPVRGDHVQRLQIGACGPPQAAIQAMATAHDKSAQSYSGIVRGGEHELVSLRQDLVDLIAWPSWAHRSNPGSGIHGKLLHPRNVNENGVFARMRAGETVAAGAGT